MTVFTPQVFWVVVSNMFFHFYHYLRKISNLTNIFQMALFQGWFPVVDKNTHNFHHGVPHMRTTPTSKGQWLAPSLWCFFNVWLVWEITGWWQLNHFLFSPQWSNLTHIFQIGWNHQLDKLQFQTLRFFWDLSFTYSQDNASTNLDLRKVIVATFHQETDQHFSLPSNKQRLPSLKLT